MQTQENTCIIGDAIALFTEQGVMTDSFVSRKEAHRKGIPHGASHTFVYKWADDKLYLLLQRRSFQKDSFPGRLDISSAGHIDYGMNFIDTAVKELYEELGIEVEQEQLQELFTQRVHQENVFHGSPFIDFEFNTVYALEMACDIESLRLQEEEVCEAVWMPADDILASFDARDGLLCSDEHEVRKAISMLKQKN